MRSSRRAGDKPLRVGFLLTVNLGNAVRYEILRSCVQDDPDLDAVWVPQRSWLADDWLRVFPGWLRVRLRHVLDSLPIFLPRRFDAVVVHSPELWGVYGTFHSLFRRRCVLIENPDAPTEHGGRLSEQLQAIANRRVDRFIPWTQHVADLVPERAGYVGAPIQVIPAGAMVSRWSEATERDRVRSDPMRILFVGGEPTRKGLDLLLDALDLLPDHYVVDVVTSRRNLPSELAARMERSASIRVHFDVAPMSDELFSLYRDTDLLVLPTRYDLYPNVFVEGLASGVPGVGTDVGGLSEIVLDGVTGFVVQPEDAAAIADAIEEARTMSDARWSAMVEAARAHAIEAHDAPTNARRLIAAIRETVAAKRGGRAPAPTST